MKGEYLYTAFGETTIVTNIVDSDFQYAGLYVHARSGLNLTLTRALNVSRGRFVNRDSSGESGGMNLFTYVSNNPLNLVDPTGLGESCGCGDDSGGAGGDGSGGSGDGEGSGGSDPELIAQWSEQDTNAMKRRSDQSDRYYMKQDEIRRQNRLPANKTTTSEGGANVPYGQMGGTHGGLGGGGGISSGGQGGGSDMPPPRRGHCYFDCYNLMKGRYVFDWYPPLSLPKGCNLICCYGL